MRQSDIDVGQEYAYDTRSVHSYRDRARVSVTSAPSGGRVAVLILKAVPGPDYDGKVQRVGQTVVVETRRISGPWQQWQADAKAAKEAAEAKQREHDIADARREETDPVRELPATYQPEWARHSHPFEAAQLDSAYRAAGGLGPYGTIDAGAMLGPLPDELRRDVLAATAAEQARAETGPGTVGAVLARCAQVLAASRVEQDGYQGDWPLRACDGDFINAVVAEAAAGGGQLLLPPTPNLPSWATLGPLVAPMGWLRAAFAYTSGQKVHAPGCRTTGHREGADAPTMPLWQVAITDQAHICGSCGGPGLKQLVEFAHFAAAADVWDARGRTGIERWQRAALARLLGATLVERLSGGEPDVTAAASLVGALSRDAPGADGWDAYYLANSRADQLEKMGAAARAAARDLAVRRVNQALGALPANLRLIPLARSATEAHVALTFKNLVALVAALLGEPLRDVQILMWTLPGRI